METKTSHLSFNVIWRAYNNVQQGHPKEVMRELGITYQHDTPQSMAEAWWFWNCENIPTPLPDFLSIIEIDPMTCIDFGLTQEDAERIRDYNKQDNLKESDMEKK